MSSIQFQQHGHIVVQYNKIYILAGSQTDAYAQGVQPDIHKPLQSKGSRVHIPQNLSGMVNTKINRNTEKRNLQAAVRIPSGIIGNPSAEGALIPLSNCFSIHFTKQHNKFDVQSVPTLYPVSG